MAAAARDPRAVRGALVQPVPLWTRLLAIHQPGGAPCYGQCDPCKRMLEIIGRANIASALMMQIRRRSREPLFTNNPTASTMRPAGKSTTQHSTTPKEFIPDQSPHFGGNAVDHTMKTPQATAGTANTRAKNWRSRAIFEGFVVRDSAKAGVGLPTLPIRFNPFQTRQRREYIPSQP
jgi:hypothetical protein